MDKKEKLWLKAKGYLHLTPQIDITKNKKTIISKVTNPEFVSTYAFYPLIHSILKERRYKRKDSNSSERAHSYRNENGEPVRNIKLRPLHYSTHLDALIFGYYADLLQSHYEKRIQEHVGLSESIIAYRRIPTSEGKSNKSTIHFAKEVFDEIKNRSKQGSDCIVLTFDIKSFFSSLNHELLKSIWADILGVSHLPKDHLNVFKASTRFSYILHEDLCRHTKNGCERKGYDEGHLAHIRNRLGKQSLFSSPKEFRDKVKSGEVRIHKYPFRDKITKKPIGIPQGLPISAVLANMYLFSFDLSILNELVKKSNVFYRRYSDDLFIICTTSNATYVETFVTNALQESFVQISKDKTEKFIFKQSILGNTEPRLLSYKYLSDGTLKVAPVTYLGFEFNGKNAFIKSTNLAKYYRRVISCVKRKARRAKKMAEKDYGQKPVIYRRQLYKLCNDPNLKRIKVHSNWKKIVKHSNGEFRVVSEKKTKLFKSNYLTYVNRASRIMEEPAIINQFKKHKLIFNQAIQRHLKK
ncbi:reverse transcriptase domain-containing protein [Siphonobacter sp. BAB-5385]|uniref:reverse transcriptase domain-containing protein n=1 Tax=Siphonobacter sp. BAB-5385 TaxID=1864822 RepID=UPI001595F7D5|nr:reverse transcriptase domain-containing protein [Siphonobacter sp. BAB-5385]